MDDEPFNIVLEHLRYIRKDIGEMRGDLRDLRDRIGNLELSVVSFRRDFLSLEETAARLQASQDRMHDRTARIEQRLDISEI